MNSRAQARAQARAQLKDDIGTAIGKGQIPCTCPITGMIFTISCNGITHLPVMSYQAPWASTVETRRILKHKSLSDLPSSLLAGMILVLAGPTGYGLIELQDMDAVEANRSICYASHEVLCLLLRALSRIDKTGAACCPHIALPQAVEAGIGYSIRLLAQEVTARLPRTATQEITQLAEAQGITILSKQQRNALALARAVAAKPQLAKYEVEFAKSQTYADAREQFKQDRNEARAIWQDMLGMRTIFSLSDNLVGTMTLLLKGDTLNTCNEALRAKLVTAITHIKHPRAQALARLIKETKNPYDLVGQQNAAVMLEDVGLGSAPAQAKRSLAEIIAAKKQAKQQAAGIIFSTDARKADGTPEDF